ASHAYLAAAAVNWTLLICAPQCCPSFFFQAEDGIRVSSVTGVQTCALPIYPRMARLIPIFGPKARESGRIAPVTRLTSRPWPVSFRPKLLNSRDFGTFRERP